MGTHHTPSQEKALAGNSPPDGFKRVYYLTPAQFAISNVALRRVKVARFSDLNDPFELLGVDRSNVKNRHALRKKTGKINDETGLLCFSKSWSNPVLWGHYGERHAGICMGFDVVEDHLHEVEYEESLGQVKRDSKTGELVLTTKDIDRLMRTKFKDWKYEQEMRFFVKLMRCDHASAEQCSNFVHSDRPVTSKMLALNSDGREFARLRLGIGGFKVETLIASPWTFNMLKSLD